MRRTLKDRPGAPMHPVSIIWDYGVCIPVSGVRTVPDSYPQCQSFAPLSMIQFNALQERRSFAACGGVPSGRPTAADTVTTDHW